MAFLVGHSCPSSTGKIVPLTLFKTLIVASGARILSVIGRFESGTKEIQNIQANSSGGT